MKKILLVLFFAFTCSTVLSQPWYARGDFNGWGLTDELLDNGTGGDVSSGDGIYSKLITITSAGRNEWKVADTDYTLAYPGPNSWVITTTSPQAVLFTFDSNTYSDGWFPTTNIVNASDQSTPTSNIIAVGDHQSWNNAGTEIMVDDGTSHGDWSAGDGIYAYSATIGTAGTFNWKPTISGSWDAWGNDNRSTNSSNFQYTTTESGQTVYFYLNVNTGRITTTVTTPLPVELTSFTAASTSSATVLLNWTTTTEVNNYGFEVEASNNSSDWETLGFVEGHGNSNSPKQYSFVANSGAKYYRLKQLDTDGAFEYSDIIEVASNLTYKLAQNHPNPFNPTTTISFTIPEAAKVNIAVYNALGQEVTELANREFGAGNHSVKFNAANLNSGIYFYRFLANTYGESEQFSQTMKMLLIK